MKSPRTDIYLTSTFRHAWNRSFNPIIGQKLEAKGISCYLAHRDTDQTATPDEIFRQDIAGINQSKVILCVAENESPNWGAELGYAYGRNIPIIALAQQDHALPLICNGMVTKIIRAADLNLIDIYLDELVQEIRSYI